MQLCWPIYKALFSDLSFEKKKLGVGFHAFQAGLELGK